MKSGAEPRFRCLCGGQDCSIGSTTGLSKPPKIKIVLFDALQSLSAVRIDPQSDSLRVIDRYDEAPNAWIFGIYVDGELCSSIRIHVLTSEARTSYATELFGDILHPRLDRARFSSIRPASLRTPKKPSDFRNFRIWRCGSAIWPATISMPIPGWPWFVTDHQGSIARSSFPRRSRDRVRFRTGLDKSGD